MAFQEESQFLRIFVIADGVFGVQPFSIVQFFKKRKYNVVLTVENNKIDWTARAFVANILFYWHGEGAHYIAVEWSTTQFIAYNENNHYSCDKLGYSLWEYMKKRGYSLITMISIKGRFGTKG